MHLQAPGQLKAPLKARRLATLMGPHQAQAHRLQSTGLTVDIAILVMQAYRNKQVRQLLWVSQLHRQNVHPFPQNGVEVCPAYENNAMPRTAFRHASHGVASPLRGGRGQMHTRV